MNTKSNHFLNIDIDKQEFRDALRFALQSALAAILCFITLEAFGSDEKFVGVLSAVLIVQPSIGKTISAGFERLLATIVGSLVGLTCLFVLPGAYSLIVALAFVVFVMNFITGFRPEWGYGVVAAIALALADTTGNMDIAQARAISIGVGIGVGIIASLIFWPESSEKAARRHCRRAIEAAAIRFKWALLDESEASEANESRQKFHDALSQGRDIAATSKDKTRERLQDIFDGVEELYNSIIVINRVESPLSFFDQSIITRDELSDKGQKAILSLRLGDEDHHQKFADFKSAISKIESNLSDNDPSSRKTTNAHSVAFALNEMARCISHVNSNDIFKAP